MVYHITLETEPISPESKEPEGGNYPAVGQQVADAEEGKDARQTETGRVAGGGAVAGGVGVADTRSAVAVVDTLRTEELAGNWSGWER